MTRLYIVAPDARKAEVMNDLVRPTVDALEPPLRTVCGFIPYSRLFAEAETVRRYSDQLKPGFLSGIAEYAPHLDEGVPVGVTVCVVGSDLPYLVGLPPQPR
jgi:hypothetical protein